MKWCQNCQTEFEDYVKKCSDCGALLITDDEYEAQQNGHKKVQHKSRLAEVQQDAVQLAVVYESTLESDVLLVSDLLKENGIISEIKTVGTGSYLQIYSGVNCLGTSVCVKEEDAETAKTLIHNFWGKIDGETSEEMHAYRQQYERINRRRRNLLKGLLVVMFASSAIIMVIAYLNVL